MFRSFDASTPPQTAPPGCQAVCGYLGGDTPHVWTLEEWQRFAHLRQAGIWVYAQGSSPRLAGELAAQSARSLGWAPNHSPSRVIWLDMELANDPAWQIQFTSAVFSGGFSTGTYRSLSSLEAGGDPHSIGEWIAEWNGIPAVEPIPRVVGHQYLANQPWEHTEVDYSVFDQDMWRRFGVGPRKEVIF